MSYRRRMLVLASLAAVVGVGVPALSAGAGGPCSPSTPQYCPPAKVKTGPATHITAHSAILTGTVNPNGSATQCSFEYGTTKNYGSPTPTQNVGSGTSNIHVSATITGLSPKTTYHFQLTCKNLGGSSAGGDKSFKTHGVPKKRPRVTTERAKHRSSTSAVLLGTVDPNGSATKCFFKYGLTDGYGSKTPAKGVGSGRRTKAFSARVTHLAPKTVYHFGLFCTNAGGTAKGRDRRTETRNKIRFRGSSRIHVSSKGAYFVRVHCYGNHHCVGYLTLTGQAGKRLARRVRYVVPAHQTKRLKMRLTAAALKQISISHHLTGRLRAGDLDGSFASRKVRLRGG